MNTPLFIAPTAPRLPLSAAILIASLKVDVCSTILRPTPFPHPAAEAPEYPFLNLFLSLTGSSMAEDLPPNLDDGELWLPSDVICAVGACRHHHHRVSGRLAPYPNDFGAMDDLAAKLASFGLLERRRDVKSSHEFSPKPELCGKERAVFFFSKESVGYKPAGGQRISAVSANSVSGGGTGAFFPFSRTVHKSHPGIPVECQKVDGFQLERARVLQRQHKCHGLTRYMPVRPGGSGRESAGTGVFLPRAVNVDSNKKPWSVKGILHSQQRQPMWSPMAGRQASSFLPAAEMGLPPDWTY